MANKGTGIPFHESTPIFTHHLLAIRLSWPMSEYKVEKKTNTHLWSIERKDPSGGPLDMSVRESGHKRSMSQEGVAKNGSPRFFEIQPCPRVDTRLIKPTVRFRGRVGKCCVVVRPWKSLLPPPAEQPVS
jgi:hypothetical protein